MDEDQPPLGEEFVTAEPTVGEKLRRARTDKGIELVAIARETRIPIRHLTAIETDAHDSLPALPYAIGFVKTFAQHVGLAPAAMATQFKLETTMGVHVPLVAAPLEPLDERRVPSPALIAACVAGVIAVVAVIWAYGAGLVGVPPASTPTPPPAAVATLPEPLPVPVEAAPAPVDVAATDPNAPPAEGTDPAAAPVAVAEGGPLVIKASEDAWFKVYDAEGVTVKMGVLAAGESYTVPGDLTGLKLWTGNAGALSLSLGGKMLPAVGALKQTVKDVSLAPTDLTGRPTPE